MSIRLLLDARAAIAENLLWDPARGALFWTDIKAPSLYRLDLRSGQNVGWTLPDDVGAIALADGEEGAIVALRDGIYLRSFRSGACELVARAPWDKRLFRFNEGLCDADGRFWVGCMFDPPHGTEEKRQGPLQSWTSAAGLHAHGNGASCHNGMAWTPDGRGFYLTHSQRNVIDRHDYAQGALGPARVFAEPSGNGIPDGAAVDAEGAYWCAIHGGGCLHRYAPDGTLLRRVELPVSQPTMCAFVGPDLRTMVISSASDKLGPAQLAQEPYAGSLFAFEPGVRGLERPTTAR